MVTLEELAAQFDLRVQEAIKRLEDLQEMGRLTGMTVSFAFGSIISRIEPLCFILLHGLRSFT